jgi:hypothetical protein
VIRIVEFEMSTRATKDTLVQLPWKTIVFDVVLTVGVSKLTNQEVN